MTGARRSIGFIVLAAGLGLAGLFAGLRVAAPRVTPLTHPLTGRPVAGMATDTRWLDRGSREAEETPDLAMDLVGVGAGMTVADVGAGTGFWTIRLAARVGGTGGVFATEIQPAMLQTLRDKVRDAGVSNVTVVEGTDDDTRLPENALDLVLLVDVYHEARRPRQLLQSIRRALKSTGRLVIIEYRKEDPGSPVLPMHRMSVAEARTEIEAEGFALDRLIPDLPRQHILVFRFDVASSR